MLPSYSMHTQRQSNIRRRRNSTPTLPPPPPPLLTISAKRPKMLRKLLPRRPFTIANSPSSRRSIPRVRVHSRSSWYYIVPMHCINSINIQRQQVRWCDVEVECGDCVCTDADGCCGVVVVVCAH